MVLKTQALQTVQIIERFYHRFTSERAIFLTSIQGISSETERLSYTNLMLNRLMFLYFLQHKGFLDNDPCHLSNHLRFVQEHQGENKFYHQYLLPLFCQELHLSTLDPTFMVLLDKISTLDLFQTHALEGNNSHIQIPDDAFARLFHFFDTYRWQPSPQAPQTENQLSPDVFTYIFERHINRKQAGAYYTRQDVTEYIARNTIISYLFDTVKAKYPAAFAPGAIWHLLQINPDRYISASLQHPDFLPTETQREYKIRRTRYAQLRTMLQTGTICNIHDLITHNLNIHQFAQDVLLTCEKLDLLLAFYTCIEQITVLDPTSGTGAFLFAALNTLKPLYAACLDRIQVLIKGSDRLPTSITFPDQTRLDVLLRQTEQDRNHFILTSIITNNLYGVDVMKEATEICKLLLFLALLTDVERIEDVNSLPPLNFHLRTGNTLVGFIHAHEFNISTFTNLQGNLDSLLAAAYGIDAGSISHRR